MTRAWMTNWNERMVTELTAGFADVMGQAPQPD